ncbi:geranylgeranylglyceryl/heptaprenylglyceryl phosphate synthase [bacterium]|nr:geranylgeranylglyceryl/heptaprenylglyceryl phosphate synthase [bacterium]
MTTFDTLLKIRRSKGAGLFILLDPDDNSPEELAARAAECETAGVDALLMGGSLLLRDGFDEAVKAVKKACKIPVIIFPGGPGQLSGEADAVLFLSLISGRNAQRLIGDQIVAAPAVKQLGLEAIPTGYMLISSGSPTAVEFISDTRPIPRHKPGLAAATALAGQYLGLKLIYLEAGSGADQSVPVELISTVRQWVDLPIIVGGGIRTPDEAAEKVRAGADFIVIGTALEDPRAAQEIGSFYQVVQDAAIHKK